MGKLCLPDNLKRLGARGSGIGFELVHFIITSIGDIGSVREIQASRAKEVSQQIMDEPAQNSGERL